MSLFEFFLHNGIEDSGLSLAMPYYMALAGGLEILQRWYFQIYREHLALSAFIKSFPSVFLASLMCHIYSAQLSAGDLPLLPRRKGLGMPLSPGCFLLLLTSPLQSPQAPFL